MSKKKPQAPFYIRAGKAAGYVFIGVLIGQNTIYSGTQSAVNTRVSTAIEQVQFVSADNSTLRDMPPIPQRVIDGVTAAAREVPLSERKELIAPPATHGTAPHTLREPVERAMRHA